MCLERLKLRASNCGRREVCECERERGTCNWTGKCVREERGERYM